VSKMAFFDRTTASLDQVGNLKIALGLVAMRCLEKPVPHCCVLRAWVRIGLKHFDCEDKDEMFWNKVNGVWQNRNL